MGRRAQTISCASLQIATPTGRGSNRSWVEHQNPGPGRFTSRACFLDLDKGVRIDRDPCYDDALRLSQEHNNLTCCKMGKSSSAVFEIGKRRGDAWRSLLECRVQSGRDYHAGTVTSGNARRRMEWKTLVQGTRSHRKICGECFRIMAWPPFRSNISNTRAKVLVVVTVCLVLQKYTENYHTPHVSGWMIFPPPITMVRGPGSSGWMI